MSQDCTDVQESALGLKWNCRSDVLGYKTRTVKPEPCTLRHIYKVLATQYDPLGFILPFTTRAKILVQRLWDKQREWDDPNLPDDLLISWKEWEGEFPTLSNISLPRCLISPDTDQTDITRQIHIFCDASEQAYGSVAYLRTGDDKGHIQLAFIIARSRVAPERKLTIPRLELCAALSGAQLAQLLNTELTLDINTVMLWTDSTTVLAWLKAESYRFKVFVGTRIAEIQELTTQWAWRYVNSNNNPADDLTRGKTLYKLSVANRWSQGPSFHHKPESAWPITPQIQTLDDKTEKRKGIFCCLTTAAVNSNFPDITSYKTWNELVEGTVQRLKSTERPSAEDYQTAEWNVLQKSQADSFPDEYRLLKVGKPVHSSSRLLALAPEFDASCQLIRVGGRLLKA